MKKPNLLHKAGDNQNIVKVVRDKMYLIKNENGDYYSGFDDTFYPNMGNATFCDTQAQIRGIIKGKGLANVEVEIVSPEEFWNNKAHLMTEIMIITATLNYKLSNDLKNSITHLGKHSKGLKKSVNDLLKKTEEIQKEFDYFCDVNEDDVLDVQGDFESFIYFLSRTQFRNIKDFALVAEALQHNPKAIMGITNKVLNEKKQKK